MATVRKKEIDDFLVYHKKKHHRRFESTQIKLQPLLLTKVAIESQISKNKYIDSSKRKGE